MDFCPGSPVVVVTLADVWPGCHLVVSACYAHQPPVADAVDWGVEEGHDWTVRVQVDDIELQLLFQVYHHHVRVLQRLLVLGRVELVQLEVVLH